MSKAKYPTIQPGQVILIGHAPAFHKMACCDCGLVHRLKFWNVDGSVYMQAWRDNRSTAAYRRTRKPKADK